MAHVQQREADGAGAELLDLGPGPGEIAGELAPLAFELRSDLTAPPARDNRVAFVGLTCQGAAIGSRQGSVEGRGIGNDQTNGRRGQRQARLCRGGARRKEEEDESEAGAHRGPPASRTDPRTRQSRSRGR